MTNFPPYSIRSAAQVFEEGSVLFYPQLFEGQKLTYNPQAKRLYVHLFAWPFNALHLDGYRGKIEYAQLLNDASEIKMEDQSDSLTLRLPVKKPPVTVPVIELFLK